MKGFTKNKKFIPMTDYKKVTRKSRDKKSIGVRLARESNDSSELKEQIQQFNGKSSIKIEFGIDKFQKRGLKVKGQEFLIKKMTEKEAINCLKFTNWILVRQ